MHIRKKVKQPYQIPQCKDWYSETQKFRPNQLVIKNQSSILKNQTNNFHCNKNFLKRIKARIKAQNHPPKKKKEKTSKCIQVIFHQT
jgi:hypothetical protein